MRHRTFPAIVFAAALALLGTASCSSGGSSGSTIGINVAAMDKTIAPGSDFYGYANANWMKATEIPGDRANVGSHYIADRETEERITALVGDVVKSDPAAGSDAARIKAYYTAYNDRAGIDAAGIAPVQGDLNRFAAIANKTDLSRVLGEQLRADVDPINSTDWQTENLFGAFVTQALAGGDVVPYLLQGGLGMPEREYYLSADAKMAGLRTQYRAYIEQVLVASGMPDAAAKADRIFALETKIAQAHATRAESEDFTKSAEEWTRGEFATRAPGIDWNAFFAAAQLGNQPKFAAYHAKAITRLSALVASEPLDSWKAWLAFHQLSMNADVLPVKFDDARFAFYGTALSGTKAIRPRDKRALASLNDAMGDAVGKLYTEKYFPASAKAEVQTMVGAIKAAFAQRVTAIDWLAPATKQEALAKVQNIVVGVGYPDHWTSYDALTIAPNNAYANKQAAQKLHYTEQLAKIGKPMDRGEWWMNAQLVNAVNLPVQNGLNFPAAILQKPFFDAKADPAFNYGAIGAVIGHEISHSFDNNGAAFDASGKMRNWWTDSDARKFEAAGKALADQYDGYEALPGLHVNGKLTLGENIADVAGLAAAFDAYHASLKGKAAPVIDGFTGDQRFFIAFAQGWASKMREEALRGRIATDGHAPGNFRALTVRNIDGWYAAFGVKPGDKLYLLPEQRVRIW
jgi:predicted metalloendopeptidase